MTLFIIGLICIVLTVISIFIFYQYYAKKLTCITELQEITKKLNTKNQQLQQDNEALALGIQKLITQEYAIRNNIAEAQTELTRINQTLLVNSEEASKITELIQHTIDTAFLSYEKTLEKQYLLTEREYDTLMQQLQACYNDRQTELLNEYETASKVINDVFKEAIETCAADLAQEHKELDKIRATRTAATEALVREQAIKDQQAFYSLNPSTLDLEDIKMLEGLKERLSKPRILSMLIWQTFYQKPMTQLCNNVLGATTVRGIYKITNQLNGMCYIGQAVDIATRWKEHAKCGLGIDTPAGNKLYKAMLKDGIQNFTWELLEKCSAEELNAKEAYYIELYDSYRYGYNSNTGVKK